MKGRLPDFGLAHKTRKLRDRIRALGFRLNRGTEYAWLVYREETGILHARIDNLTHLDLWIQLQSGKGNSLGIR